MFYQYIPENALGGREGGGGKEEKDRGLYKAKVQISYTLKNQRKKKVTN